MTRLDPAGEPSMEEILASIRRIIAEDPPGSRPQVDPPANGSRKAARGASTEPSASPRQPDPAPKAISGAEFDIEAQLGSIAPGARLNGFAEPEVGNYNAQPAGAQDSVQAALDSLRQGQPPAAAGARARDPFDFTLPGARLEPQPPAKAGAHSDPFEFTLGPSPFARGTPVQPAAPIPSPATEPEVSRANSPDRLGGFVPTRMDPFAREPVHPGPAFLSEAGPAPSLGVPVQPKSDALGVPLATPATAAVEVTPATAWPADPEPTFASVEIVRPDTPAAPVVPAREWPQTPAAATPAAFQMEPPASSRPVFGGPSFADLATPGQPHASLPVPAHSLPEPLSAPGVEPPVSVTPVSPAPAASITPATFQPAPDYARAPPPAAGATVTVSQSAAPSPALSQAAPAAAVAADPAQPAPSQPAPVQIQSDPILGADVPPTAPQLPAATPASHASVLPNAAASAAAAVLEQIARPLPVTADPEVTPEPALSQPSPGAAPVAGTPVTAAGISSDAVRGGLELAVAAPGNDEATIVEPDAGFASASEAADAPRRESTTSGIELHEAFVEDLAVAAEPVSEPFASHGTDHGRGALTMRSPTDHHDVDAPRTMEDTVADLLRPMLKNWLAENMPRIVERALRKELEESNRSEHKTAAE